MTKEQINDFANRTSTQTVKDQTFDYDVDIKSVQLTRIRLDHKQFVDCNFKSFKVSEFSFNNLQFQNCSFENVDLNIHGHAAHLEFTDCQIGKCTINASPNVMYKKLILAGSKTVIQELDIQGKVFDCFIKDCKIEVGYINTAGCKQLVLSGVHDSGGEEAEAIEIRGGIEGTASFTNVVSSKIRLSGLTCPKVSFEGITDSSVAFLDTNLTQLRIQKSSETAWAFDSFVCGDLVLSSGHYSTLDFANFITVTLDISYEGNVKIDKLLLNDLLIDTNSRLSFNKTTIDHIEGEALDNKGTIRITNSRITSSLKLVDSTLGKLFFYNVYLAKECAVNFIETDITDTVFSNFQWNKDYKILESKAEGRYEDDYSFLTSIRESYRQLKANQIKNNNKITSLEFQRHELDIHYQILKLELNERSNTRSAYLKNLGNYLIMWTHKKVSDFGQNIWKPLVLLGIFHLILFNILLLTKSEIGFVYFQNVSSSSIWDAVDLYFYTMIPTHGFTINDYVKGDPVFIAGTVDFLMRIFSGYFIFYFVAASRKYHL